MKHEDKISKHYRNLFLKHGDSPLSAQYSSRESQFNRFKSLVRIGNLTGKKILDFGCGTASLAEFLEQAGQKPSYYHGVDIVEDFFETAKRKIPYGVFTHPNRVWDSRFDYTFVSGVFNNKRSNNRKFWQDTITKLFSITDIGMAFNMMSIYVDYKDSQLFYEKPETVFKFIKKNITPYVSILNDYIVKDVKVPFEFTVLCYRYPIKF
jgi:hypothetical protein